MAVVDVPPSFPPKWDLADALPEGWTVERLSELLENAPHRSLPCCAPIQ